jgi:hypothetical protein
VRQMSLALALAAGLAGGVVSHYIWPEPAQAQSQNPKEIRAQSFVLEDANGQMLGIFSAEALPSGRGAGGSIRLFSDRGREIWRNPSGFGIVPAK